MKKPENKDRFVIIMAGGRGERFWPVSREKTPKQLIRLLGQQPFDFTGRSRERQAFDGRDDPFSAHGNFKQAFSRSKSDLRQRPRDPSATG